MIRVAKGDRLGWRGRAALALLASVLIAGAAAARPIAASPADTSPCTRAQAAAAFESFVAYFNRGAFAKLDALFAAEPAFQWYSSPHPGRRLGAGAKDRDTLIPYFRRRHASNDELRPFAFYFSGNSRRWSNFWFEALRRADGFDHGRWRGVIGKGAMVCERGSPRIIVLSLGGPAPRR